MKAQEDRSNSALLDLTTEQSNSSCSPKNNNQRRHIKDVMSRNRVLDGQNSVVHMGSQLDQRDS